MWRECSLLRSLRVLIDWHQLHRLDDHVKVTHMRQGEETEEAEQVLFLRWMFLIGSKRTCNGKQWENQTNPETVKKKKKTNKNTASQLQCNEANQWLTKLSGGIGFLLIYFVHRCCWTLNSGPHTCKANVLLLSPILCDIKQLISNMKWGTRGMTQWLPGLTGLKQGCHKC